MFTNPLPSRSQLLAGLKALLTSGCPALDLPAQLPGIPIWHEDEEPSAPVTAPYLIIALPSDPETENAITTFEVQLTLALPIAVSDSVPPSADYNHASRAQYEINLRQLLDARYPITGIPYQDQITDPPTFRQISDYLNYYGTLAGHGAEGLITLPRWQWPIQAAPYDPLKDNGDGTREITLTTKIPTLARGAQPT